MKARPARRIVEQQQAAQAIYSRLVAELRGGARPAMARIDGVLMVAGKTARDLVADVLAGDRAGAWPGDPCPRCKTGRLVVYATKTTGGRRTQYLACNACRHRPPGNKRTVTFLPGPGKSGLNGAARTGQNRPRDRASS